MDFFFELAAKIDVDLRQSLAAPSRLADDVVEFFLRRLGFDEVVGPDVSPQHLDVGEHRHVDVRLGAGGEGGEGGDSRQRGVGEEGEGSLVIARPVENGGEGQLGDGEIAEAGRFDLGDLLRELSLELANGCREEIPRLVEQFIDLFAGLAFGFRAGQFLDVDVPPGASRLELGVEVLGAGLGDAAIPAGRLGGLAEFGVQPPEVEAGVLRLVAVGPVLGDVVADADDPGDFRAALVAGLAVVRLDVGGLCQVRRIEREVGLLLAEGAGDMFGQDPGVVAAVAEQVIDVGEEIAGAVHLGGIIPLASQLEGQGEGAGGLAGERDDLGLESLFFGPLRLLGLRVLVADLVDLRAGEAEGGGEVAGVAGTAIERGEQSADHRGRGVFVFAGIAVDLAGTVERLLQDAVPLGGFEIFPPGQLFEPAGQFPLNAQPHAGVGRAAIGLEPGLRFLNHDLRVFALFVIEADQAELQHAGLQVFERAVAFALVFEEFVVDAERLGELVHFFEAFALPEAGVEPHHQAAVLGVDRFEAVGRLDEGRLVLGGAAVVGLGFLVDHAGQVELGLDVIEEDPFAGVVAGLVGGGNELVELVVLGLVAVERRLEDLGCLAEQIAGLGEQFGFAAGVVGRVGLQHEGLRLAGQHLGGFTVRRAGERVFRVFLEKLLELDAGEVVQPGLLVGIAGAASLLEQRHPPLVGEDFADFGINPRLGLQLLEQQQGVIEIVAVAERLEEFQRSIGRVGSTRSPCRQAEPCQQGHRQPDSLPRRTHAARPRVPGVFHSLCKIPGGRVPFKKRPPGRPRVCPPFERCREVRTHRSRPRDLRSHSARCDTCRAGDRRRR